MVIHTKLENTYAYMYLSTMHPCTFGKTLLYPLRPSAEMITVIYTSLFVISLLINTDTIRYDTIEEMNVDSKAEYTA